jgi:hypothetical protein
MHEGTSTAGVRHSFRRVGGSIIMLRGRGVFYSSVVLGRGGGSILVVGGGGVLF